jgi:hypothetical protein
MSLEKKVKTSLDETRLLILGANILLGFQFNGAFQNAFDELTPLARRLDVVAILLMLLVVALLITPSMQHRIVEEGQATKRIHRSTSLLAGLALGPFALALGLGLFIAFERPFGLAAATAAGVGATALALFFWYAIEALWRRDIPMKDRDKTTPIEAKIEQMLTEARVLLPGVQALLGFGLVITLTQAFEQLPFSSKLVHGAVLLLLVLAIVLLMAPAAIHRISFGGEDTEKFHTIGSRFVIAAPVPLGLGMAGDTYVVVTKILSSPTAGAIAAAAVLIVVGLLWYAVPAWIRRTKVAA